MYIYDSSNHRSLRKNLEVTLLFVDFFNVFDSIHRGKMAEIFLAYGLSQETITAIMMFYSNINVKVCLPDGVTNFFDIAVDVLQGNTLAPYLFIGFYVFSMETGCS